MNQNERMKLELFQRIEQSTSRKEVKDLVREANRLSSYENG